MNHTIKEHQQGILLRQILITRKIRMNMIRISYVFLYFLHLLIPPSNPPPALLHFLSHHSHAMLWVTFIITIKTKTTITPFKGFRNKLVIYLLSILCLQLVSSGSLTSLWEKLELCKQSLQSRPAVYNCMQTYTVYLPWTFTVVMVTAVYIPPDENASSTLGHLYDTSGSLQTTYPEAVHIIAEDCSNADLKRALPKFHQRGNCVTRRAK